MVLGMGCIEMGTGRNAEVGRSGGEVGWDLEISWGHNDTFRIYCADFSRMIRVGPVGRDFSFRSPGRVRISLCE